MKPKHMNDANMTPPCCSGVGSSSSGDCASTRGRVDRGMVVRIGQRDEVRMSAMHTQALFWYCCVRQKQMLHTRGQGGQMGGGYHHAKLLHHHVVDKELVVVGHCADDGCGVFGGESGKAGARARAGGSDAGML